MRLMAKVWRSLLNRDFQTWSPEMGAMYRSMLGHRKIVGFEWEIPELENKQKSILWGDIRMSVSKKSPVSVGEDGKYTEIRVGYWCGTPKWVIDFFNTYRICYSHGVLLTGYHVSYNAPTIINRYNTHRLDRSPNMRHIRASKRYHYLLFGNHCSIQLHTPKSLRILNYPYLYQFKPCMASIIPQQVLFDTILRNQIIKGAYSRKFNYNKIEDMAAVLLSATPQSLTQLFNYPAGCFLGDLVGKRLRV